MRMIRPVTVKDQAALLALCEAVELFEPRELAELANGLSDYFSGKLGRHTWVVDDDGELQAAAYYVPEAMTDGTWNLLFIGVRAALQGGGRGGALLRYIEGDLRSRGERLLVVETLGLDEFALTRTFYRKNGYEEEARIREFYAEGADKIVFRKLL